MTYREKAQTLLMTKLQMNKYTAATVIRLMEQDDYIPCAIGALNAPDDLENWDAEIPNK